MWWLSQLSHLALFHMCGRCGCCNSPIWPSFTCVAGVTVTTLPSGPLSHVWQVMQRSHLALFYVCGDVTVLQRCHLLRMWQVWLCCNALIWPYFACMAGVTVLQRSHLALFYVCGRCDCVATLPSGPLLRPRALLSPLEATHRSQIRESWISTAAVK